MMDSKTISRSFCPYHIAHFIMGYFLVRLLTAQEHHKLIAKSQIPELQDLGLYSFFPIRKFLYLVLQHSDLILNIIDFLVNNLFVLLGFRVLII